MAKPRYQFRTTDLLLITAAVGLGIVVVPYVRAGPIYGTSLSAVLLVILGGFVGVACCRLVSRPCSSLHQFLGGVLFALVGFTTAGFVPPIFGNVNATAHVLVFAGGVLGAGAGGAVGRLKGLRLRPGSSRRARILTWTGLACLAIAAAMTAVNIVMQEEPIQNTFRPSIVLMVAGGLLGTASGIFTPEHRRHFAQRFLCGILFSVVAYYVACVALAFRMSTHNQAIAVASVYVAGLVGGLIGGVLSTTPLQRAQLFGRGQKFVWYAALAPFMLAGALTAYRFVTVVRQVKDVAILGRKVNLDRGPVYDGIDPLPYLKKGKPGQFLDLRTFLGLSGITGISLCRLDFPEHTPRELDSNSIHSLASLLPTVTHLAVHAQHLEESEFVELLNAADLRRVHSMQIHGSLLNDSLFSHLPPLPALELLLLKGTAVGDDGAEQIAEFENLEVLDLSGTRVTDLSAERIAILNSLQVLFLHGTSITDRAVPQLARLQELSDLDVRQTRITNAGASRLASVPSLQVRVPLQLGVPVSGKVDSQVFHEWSFKLDADTLLCVIPRIRNSDLRWTMESMRAGPRSHSHALPPDRYWLREHYNPDSSGEQDALTTRVVFLPRGRTGSCYGLRVRSELDPSEYEFLLVDLRDSATDITAQLGDIIETELRPGAANSFRFGGIAGVELRFDALSLEGIQSGRVQMVNSRGEQLFDVPLGTDVQSVLLDSYGPFYLLIDGLDAVTSDPSFHFQLHPLPTEGSSHEG